MVERVLCMHEAQGSIPCSSNFFFFFCFLLASISKKGTTFAYTRHRDHPDLFPFLFSRGAPPFFLVVLPFCKLSYHLQVRHDRSSSSLVVMTSALHAEGREFNPPLEYTSFFSKTKRNTHMRRPGVEPGAKAWEASMLPIHHRRVLRIHIIWNLCFPRTQQKLFLPLLSERVTRRCLVGR